MDISSESFRIFARFSLNNSVPRSRALPHSLCARKQKTPPHTHTHIQTHSHKRTNQRITKSIFSVITKLFRWKRASFGSWQLRTRVLWK